MDSKTIFVPLNGRVLVRPDIAPDEKGGIIIPKNAKSEPQRGEVVSLAEVPADENGDYPERFLTAGDKILYSQYAGTDLLIDDVRHLVMSEKDILGIFKSVEVSA